VRSPGREDKISEVAVREACLPRQSEAESGAHFLPSSPTEALAKVGRVQISLGHYAFRGIKLIDETELSICNKCYKRALAQSCPGEAKRSRESRYNVDRSQKIVKVHWVLIASRCALCPPKRSESGCPGATTITNLSCVQEQKQKP
jgi:hypothetical protein